jgi:ferredoxin
VCRGCKNDGHKKKKHSDSLLNFLGSCPWTLRPALLFKGALGFWILHWCYPGGSSRSHRLTNCKMAGTGPPRGPRMGPAAPVERENLMDQKYISDDTTPKKINSIQFSMMDPHQMLRAAELKISSRDLFADSTRTPAPYGPLDTRLGTSNKKGSCTTCGASVEVCPGHFGVINLALPVYHIGYMKQILSVLRMVCRSCSRILLTDDEMKVFRKAVRSKRNFEMSRRKEVQKRIIKQCEKAKNCPFKLTQAGKKKTGPNKETILASWKTEIEDALTLNPELASSISLVRRRVPFLLPPSHVLNFDCFSMFAEQHVRRLESPPCEAYFRENYC